MLDRTSPEPLYQQLDRILRERIHSGAWAPGSPVPSENALCKEFGISRMTARSVITGLVREGLLYRVQGKGTFVPEAKIRTISPAYLGIREQLEAQGYRIGTRLLSFSEIPAPTDIAEALELEPGETVIAIERLRIANEIPVSIHQSWLPLSLCRGISQTSFAGDRQLCHVLEEDFRLKTDSVQETLSAALAGPEVSRLLEIREGSPILILEDRNRNEEGKLFEFSRIRFRGDKIDLHFEYRKS